MSYIEALGARRIDIGTMKIKLTLFGLFITCLSWGQQTIKGIVYDRKEGIMPGVVVQELGTDGENKSVTNAKGEFEINTRTPNPTLTFTFAGWFTRTIKIGKKKELKVKMKFDRPKGRDIATLIPRLLTLDVPV